MIVNEDILKWCEVYTGERFHAVLCDPPYELGFMGKSWDSTGIAFNPETWKAIAKHLYPGAYLLAFGGPRTVHRIACAIEDAGFRIMDQIVYCFGSGFPKSHNVLKGVQKQFSSDALCVCGRRYSQTVLGSQSDYPASGGSDGEPPLSESVNDPSASPSQGDAHEHIRGGQREGVQDIGQASSDPGGETAHHANEGSSSPSAHQSGDSQENDNTPSDKSESKSRASYQENRKTVSDKSDTSHLDDGSALRNRNIPLCVKCGKLNVSVLEGYGNNLKPAYEPVIVARLPLDGTIAKNVVKYGSGALNIDGCRVGTEERTYSINGATKSGNFGNGANQPASEREHATAIGRWPANLIHDGSDEVVGMFPNTKSGDLKNNLIKAQGDSASSYDMGEKISMNRQGDSGSAARFFYSAKVSKRERDAGLEGFEKRQTTGGGGLTAETLEDGSLSTASAGGKYGSVKALSHNFHPTVKPISLTTYLAKLILPP